MKIKTKKQLNLPQLIEWAQDNIKEATKKVYRVNENEVIGDHVRFTEVYSDLQVRLHGYIPFDTTFTVEVEEVVDEDTKLPKSLAIFEHNGKLYSEMHGNKNINDILKMDIKVKSSSTKTIHMVNDDGTHTLIWRDGKLVE